MAEYKQYMQGRQDEIRNAYQNEDGEFMIKLIETVIDTFDVLPEQVIRQIMLINGMFD